MRIHHWFVPNRITWPASENDGWEGFITGGADGNNSQTVPTINSDGTVKTLKTYLGIPPTAVSRACNALPVRATNEIYNKRYRDQDLITERTSTDVTIPKIAWEKDDLTSARPWTQKGSDVTLPVGSDAPIHANVIEGGGVSVYSDQESEYRFLDPEVTTVDIGATQDTVGANRLYADLSAAGAVNINDFREAFAKQRYQEARARYGSRFTEYLRYLGIRPSDARLQEPEYLGGGTARLQFSEVLQTAGTTNGSGDGVGDLYGHGIAGVRTPRFRKFFEEHGYVITLLSIRPKAVYMNGVHREFLKQNKEDFFQKELASLGSQGVKRGQVYLDQTTFQDDWAFQDRYDEYRSHPSFIGQDFRTTLNSWHMGRVTSASTELNQSFVECDPSEDIFQAATNDTCWIMLNNRVVARRMVPKRANPRII